MLTSITNPTKMLIWWFQNFMEAIHTFSELQGLSVSKAEHKN